MHEHKGNLSLLLLRLEIQETTNKIKAKRKAEVIVFVELPRDAHIRPNNMKFTVDETFLINHKSELNSFLSLLPKNKVVFNHRVYTMVHSKGCF